MSEISRCECSHANIMHGENGCLLCQCKEYLYSAKHNLKVGDWILVDGFSEEVVTALGEPDVSHETGRFYQEVFFGRSHCDISRCEKLQESGERYEQK